MKNLYAAVTGLVLLFSAFVVKAAEPFDTNLIKAPGDVSMDGWTVTESSGEGWYETETSVQTSYGTRAGSTATMDVRTRTIDLLSVGFSQSTLSLAPEITVGEQFKSSMTGGYYFLTVELLNSTGSVVATWSYQDATRSNPIHITSDTPWTTASYTFTEYGSDVTQVRFTDGGVDDCYWGGHYGPEITNSTVKLAATVVPEPGTWAMLAAGAGLLAVGKRLRRR